MEELDGAEEVQEAEEVQVEAVELEAVCAPATLDELGEAGLEAEVEAALTGLDEVWLTEEETEAEEDVGPDAVAPLEDAPLDEALLAGAEAADEVYPCGMDELRVMVEVPVRVNVSVIVDFGAEDTPLVL